MSGWENTWGPPNGPAVTAPARTPGGWGAPATRPLPGPPPATVERDSTTVADFWAPPHPALAAMMSPDEAPDVPVLSTRRAALPITGLAGAWQPPHPSLAPITDPTRATGATPPRPVPESVDATSAIPIDARARPWGAPGGSPVTSVGDPTLQTAAEPDLGGAAGVLPPTAAATAASARAAPRPVTLVRQADVERRAPASRPTPRPRRPSFRIPRWGWLAGAAIGLTTLVYVSTRGNDPSLVAAPDATTSPTSVVARATPATPAAPAAPATSAAPVTTTTIVAQLGPAPADPPVPSVAPPTDIDVTGETEGAGNDEWVRITNIGMTPLVMDGWTVRDDGLQHLYRFGPFVLGAGAHVTLFSGCGADSPSELYWCGDGTGIWNDTGDVLIVFDELESVIVRRQL